LKGSQFVKGYSTWNMGRITTGLAIRW
jgi:hypothetical protein